MNQKAMLNTNRKFIQTGNWKRRQFDKGIFSGTKLNSKHQKIKSIEIQMVNQNKNKNDRALAPSTISVTVLVVGPTLVLSAIFVYRSTDWSNTPFPPEDKYALMFFAFMMMEMTLLATVLPFLVWYAETHSSQVEKLKTRWTLKKPR